MNREQIEKQIVELEQAIPVFEQQINNAQVSIERHRGAIFAYQKVLESAPEEAEAGDAEKEQSGVHQADA